jgi:signal transduction histidine kinase/DNA-binding response OmpR family regulator
MKKTGLKIVILVIYLSGINGGFSVKARSLSVLSGNKRDTLDQINDSDKLFWQDQKSYTDSIFNIKGIIPLADLPINKTEQARAYYENGLIFYNMFEYHSAEIEFLKAIEIYEKLHNKSPLAYSCHFLGQIESWKSNYSKSIQYHKKARDLFYELKNIKYAAISNNQISFGLEALGDYDSSLLYCRKNIENRESINSPYTVLTSYQKIAALYAKLYNYKQMYSHLQEGIEYAEETGSKLSLAELYLTAGNLFLNNHVNKDIALDYLQEARILFTDTDNWTKVYLTDLYIGNVYYITGNDSLAMLYFKSVTKKAISTDYSTLSQANHLIGMVYKKKKQYDSTLVYLQKSIEVMCPECPEISIHHTLVEAGKTHLIRGNFQQAWFYLNKARNIAVETESGMKMVISYEKLANYYQALPNIDSAMVYLKMAHNLAKELDLLKKVKNTAESLSKIYYSKSEFQTSSDYLKLANQMNDSLASIEKYNEIAKLEMRFEIEKKEEERKLEAKNLQSEISKQKFIRNTSITGTLLFVIIGVLLLKAYRNKRKDNHLLAKQKKEIQDISKQLQESGKQKLDFFTNISHDIRTPLTLIKSPLERILKSNNGDKTINSQLKMALNNTNKLKDLVNQILDLQKLDEYQLGLDFSDFEIIDFCREISSSFEEYCYQSNCQLIFKSNVGKAVVKFDSGRLQSIINNLLSNAFKFNKEGGLVQFNLEINAGRIVLEIKDTGKGITAEHLKKLGERYYQVKESDFAIEGTGVGLAYAKELVELMNGLLEISSTVNKGTTVALSLPCDEIKIQDKTTYKMELKPREKIFDQLEEHLSENIENGQSRVLVIEDNYELLLFLRDIFLAQSYYVYCAKDGQEGKDMALKYIPDLIISDIMMPGIPGNKLCKMLKNNINTSHITIILFTAKGAPDSIVDGYDCGADDYIVKPFDSDLLVKKVKNIIATGENARKQFNFTDIERTKSIYSEFDKKFLKDCMLIIKDNLSNSNFTVDTIAKQIHMHRRTLLRKFNALTGKSPIELIRHTRMSQAAELIKEKKYRVNEVAFMIGYEDTNRFSQAFKKFHGISPSNYI